MTVTPGTLSQAGQDGGHPGDVVARLTAGLPAPEEDVFDVGRVELGHLGQHGLDDQGAQVVGTALDQRALVGPPDGGAAGGDDDCFRHGDWLLGSICMARDLARGRQQVTGW